MRYAFSFSIALIVGCGGTNTAIDPAPSDAGTADAPVAEAGECASDVAPRAGTVITDRGAVTGAESGETWAWKGIPFAAPPVGELRWKPPQPAACWKGEREAK